MKTIEQFMRQSPQIPMATVWLLNDLAEYRGKQELYTRQSPQRLQKLREHALIESAVASNRIEGVEIEPGRVGTVVFGQSHLQDRDEQEVRGYRAALSLIHERYAELTMSPETILKLHALIRKEIWDGGRLKEEDGEIIEKHPDGRVTVRFKPLSASETPAALDRLCSLSNRAIVEKQVPPLVVWGAQNLDFLCIHPFRDGNGRVSRLLLLLSLYHLGFSAGRFISLERIIEQSKDRYYETLQVSSREWHAGKHDPWPYINYLLYTLKNVYQEFEARYENTSVPLGEKTGVVRQAVASFVSAFHVTELHRKCPGVSLDMIRKVLKDMAMEKLVECLGRGKQAKWRRIG
ncbi:MAG: Fic family protein [bacterium]